MKRFIKFLCSCLLSCVLALILVFFFAPDTFDRITAPSAAFEAGDYDYYYYTSLNEKEKLVYTALQRELASFPERIEIPEISSIEFNHVLNVISYDDPYLFMSDGGTIITAGKRYYYEPVYNVTRQEYENALLKIDSIIDDIFKSLPQDEYDIQLYLHDYLISNCTYSDTDNREESNIIGFFLNQKAKCSGYASAFKLLLDKAGIENVLITGKATDLNGETQNHMWNAVKIDDSWVYTDTTWDDPVTDNNKEYCRRIFFCMSEDMLRRTHSEFEFDYIADNNTLYYYNVINAYYNIYNADTKAAAAQLIATAASAGENSVEFMFSNNEAYNTAVDRLFDGEEVYGILKTADHSTDKQLETNKIRYSLEKDHNLITVIFETKD